MHYIKLLRFKQWLKNLLLFLPWILETEVDMQGFVRLAIAWVAFGLMASAGYIWNDIRDLDHDRHHPRKRSRPLAAADVKVMPSLVLSIAMLVISFTISIYLGREVAQYALIYFILNIAYSVYLKRVRFLDIFVLSGFYALRLFYGAAVETVELTGGFMVTMMLAFLSLSLNKRYLEIKLTQREHLPGRGYKKGDMELLRIMMIAFALLSLGMLNVHAYFVLNIGSVVFFTLVNFIGVLVLFLYFDERKDQTDDPVDRILRNGWLLLSILLLLSLYIYEMYHPSLFIR